jgi:hypothetical protein
MEVEGGGANPDAFHHGKAPYSCNSNHNNTQAVQIAMNDRINIMV